MQSCHFADHTSLLNIQNTVSKINRSLSKDLKELSFWLNANKIELNVAKTEVILFKTKHKPCDTDLRLKLCRTFNWETHVHYRASKLNRANAVLKKLRYFVDLLLLLYSILI